MRKKYENLPDITPKHNEIHRRCFQLPYLMRIETTVPTTDTVDEGELVGYYSGSTYRIYTKINEVLKYWALT